MAFSYGYSAIAVVSSLSLVINFGLETGGPVIMIWGWLVSSIFTLFTVSSMAEICSVYPNAGNVYYWSGILAPTERSGIILSYICAWFILLGNITADSSFSFGMTQIVSACVQLFSGRDRSLSTEIEVLLSILVLFSWKMKNKMKLDQQGWFSNFSAVYQLLSTVGVISIVMILSPTLSDSEFVFKRYNNGTGFNDQSLSFYIYICLMGVLMSLFGLSGYESGAALSEETKNADIEAPKGMVKAVIASCLTGVIFLLGMLYACSNSLEGALNGLTDQSVVNILHMSTQSKTWLTLVLSLVLILNIFLAGFAHLTVTTRVTYALVRDKALPGSKWMDHLNPKTQNPDRVLLIVFLLESAFCLLPLISTTAFSALAQITTIAYNVSYGIPIALRLYQKTTISPNLRVGRYSFGKYSPLIQSLSLIWLCITSIVLLFPQKIDPIKMI